MPREYMIPHYQEYPFWPWRCTASHERSAPGLWRLFTEHISLAQLLQQLGDDCAPRNREWTRRAASARRVVVLAPYTLSVQYAAVGSAPLVVRGRLSLGLRGAQRPLKAAQPMAAAPASCAAGGHRPLAGPRMAAANAGHVAAARADEAVPRGAAVRREAGRRDGCVASARAARRTSSRPWRHTGGNGGIGLATSI